MKKSILVVAMLIIASVALVGCGGGNSKKKGQSYEEH